MSRSSQAGLAEGVDLRHASRVLAALILPIGPLAVAGLRHVLPYFSATTPSETAAGVLAAEGRQSTVLWLGLIATFTLLPGVLAVGRLTRREAPRMTAAAMLLVVPGYLALIFMIGSDLVLWTGARAGLDESTMAELAETVHPTSGIAAGVFVLGHVIGTVLLGIALLRVRAVPTWAAVVTMIAQPAHFVAFVILGSPALDAAAWAANGLAFAVVGVAILRTPDDEWDLPPVGTTPRTELRRRSGR
ncbi:hypothetical protein [Aeromicrobium sp.]|uniref:hypothetical protein n=1 Tax=Aeromicrobium sp. TaxID=1871063 RepID=UPI003D6B7459